MIQIGVDVGGTFTDLVLFDTGTGSFRVLKTPSTPPAHEFGVFEAVQRAVPQGIDRVRRFSHGSTIATNTVLERTGARLGVITTLGFRDVLVVGRGNRTRLYDVKAVRPEGLVARTRILEVAERCDADGVVTTPLDETGVRSACRTLAGLNVEAVAVCFLHSWANPDHEREAGRIIREMMPDATVSLSSDILPELREFERFSTTALNAYVAPATARYLHTLRSGLEDQGMSVPLQVMGSNGGLWTAERMAERPANAMLSGPAGGVAAAVTLARMLEVPDLITYDMGGTSTDTCLVRGYRHEMAVEGGIGTFPNRVPQIEINTVGAGGGSIASIGPGRFFSVGPRSAGAVPGPACYGKGGTEATVTDANVVLGRFRPTGELGGAIAVDVDAAHAAVAALARDLELETARAAEGIVDIAVTRMTASIKEISVMRGLDPRDFTLLAYGGAGPLHAALIASELAMGRIVIPPVPGNFSALGLLVADRRHDASRTVLTALSGTSSEEIGAVLEPLRDQVTALLVADGVARDLIRLETVLDMRFAGQAFQLSVPVDGALGSTDALTDRFREAYLERYGVEDDDPVEIVVYRVIGRGPAGEAGFPGAVKPGPAAAPAGFRQVYLFGTWHRSAIYDREQLAAGTRLEGPAVIEESGATTLVPPGFTASVVPTGCLLLGRVEQ
ncbi:MAG: hydantoinase/oxoprolinase family protein [Alphaproteobacteria bacterium]|nr:hydantoinase/oxoprolinase family protein [Alphaproteobacteria bacterium]